MSRYSFEYARRVLEQAGKGLAADSIDHARHLLSLGRCYVGEANPEMASSVFEQAEAAASRLQDATLLAECMAARVGLGHGYVPDSATKATLREAALGEVDLDPTTHTDVLVRLAVEALNEGEMVELEEVLETATQYRLHESSDESAAALNYLSYWQQTLTGDTTSRKDTVASFRGLVTDDLHAKCFQLSTLSIEALQEANAAHCTAYADELIEVGRAAGRPTSVWLASASRFVEPFLADELTEAKRRSTAAFEYASEFHLTGGLSAFAAQQFAISWLEGSLEQLIEPLESAQFPGDSFAWQAGLALAYATAGREREARSVLEALRPGLRGAATHYQAIVGIGVAAAAARLAEDTAFANAALPILTELGDRRLILGAATADFGPAGLYRALCHLAIGDDLSAQNEIRKTVAAAGSWHRIAADLMFR